MRIILELLDGTAVEARSTVHAAPNAGESEPAVEESEPDFYAVADSYRAYTVFAFRSTLRLAPTSTPHSDH